MKVILPKQRPRETEILHVLSTDTAVEIIVIP